MKQMLLIGKFNNFMNDLNYNLSRHFKLQLCSDNLELLKGMLNMYRPNIILISLNELNENHKEIFRYLDQKHMGIPVLCIGTKGEIELAHDIPECESLKKIQSPVMVKEVVDAANESLGISADVKEEKVESEIWKDKKTILLVDDAAVQLRAMESILKGSYSIRMATSGIMAIEMLKKCKPDLILLDYDMPDCDGKRTLELIQEEENGKDIPVVFVTGVNEKERIIEVLKLKPAGYLIKPVDRNKLVEMVQQVLGEE